MMHREQSSSALGKRTAATIENGVLVKQEPTKKTKYDETEANGHVHYGTVGDADSSENEDELDDERDDDDDDAAYQMERDQDNQAQAQGDGEEDDTGDDFYMANLRDDEAERPSRDSPITIRSSSTPEPSLDVLQIMVNNTKAPSASQANKSPRKQPDSKPILKTDVPKQRGQTNSGNDLQRMLSSAHRSESHWHLDGSIVVLVGKTLFKLHRSALTRQSKLFEEKINAYEHDSRRIQHSGCPVIRMDGDPEDLDVVLNALQDGFAFMSREDIPISTLCSLLIGSHAFGFGSLKNWALRAFISMWPDDVDEIPAMPETKPFALESVRLVRECRKHGLDALEFDDVLRMAMYELVRSSGFGIREEGAWVDEDRNDAIEANAMDLDDPLDRCYEGGSQHRIRSAPFASTQSRRAPSRAYLRNLLPNDVRILVRTREQLVLQWVENVARPPYLQSCGVEGCVNEGATAENRRLDGQILPATPVTSDAASSSNGRSSVLPTQAQDAPVSTQVNRSPVSPSLSHAWLNAVHYSGLFEERLNDPVIGFAILAGLVDDEYESRSFALSQSPSKREKDKRRNSTRPKSTQSTQRSSPKKKRNEDIVGALSVMQIDWEAHGFCAECETKIVNIFANKRKRVWDELNRWLELI